MNHIIELTDNIFIFIVAISVFFLLLITAAMIYFVVRYRAKKNPNPSNITGNTTLEILWTVIPLILVLMMFFYGWDGFKQMRNVPADAMVIKVTARMWFWSFEYENGRKSDTILVLPANRNVKFDLNSVDVNHSFYLPAYRMKEDVIPGRTNYLWINTALEGVYDIMCAEYCGMNHSYMLGKLHVVPDKEFQEWVKKIDTVKKVDTLKTDSAKILQDSLKTGINKTDTTKQSGSKKDSIKTVRKDTLIRREKK
ncbi:MAG TPA: cytochrome c oxidase subunit II [Ignavibacteria bacterium]|jgi:cytochrome c oxidase subunit 2